MKNCLFTGLLLILSFVCLAQDTLVLKSKKRGQEPDTMLVKLLRVYTEGKVLYYPGSDFMFTAKDSQALLHRKPIDRCGAKGADYGEIISIKYDERLKHTIFFDEILEAEERAKKKAEEARYNQKKNIVSAGGGLFSGPIMLSFDNYQSDYTYADYHESHFAFFQLAYERIILNGSAGVRSIPLVIGINDKLFGAGLGFRVYPMKQRKVTLYLGSDIIFNNNTVSRRAFPVDTANYYLRSYNENRNQLFINPFQAGFMLHLRHDYLLDFGFSVGPNVVFGSRDVLIAGDPYKIRPAPSFFMMRLVIGRKF